MMLQDLVLIDNDRSTKLLAGVVAFLPKLLLAIVARLAFWFLAKALRAGVLYLGEKIGLDELSKKTGLSTFLANTRFKQSISAIVAEIFYRILYLVGLNVAFEFLGLDVVSSLISDLISYIPNLFIAVVLIVIGTYAAKFVKEITDGAMATAKIDSSWIGHVVYFIVLLFALVTALKQAKIDISFLTDNINTIVMGFMLAIGLAFGLGGKEKAKEIIDKYFK